MTPTARLVAVVRDIKSEKAEFGEVSLALWMALDEALAALDATTPTAEPTDDCGTALAAKRQPLDHPASDEELYSLHEIAFDDAGPVTEPTGKKQIIAAARALYRLGVERERARQDATKPRPFGDEATGFWSERVGDVEITRERSPLPGWAVVVEGEPESFEAFFVSRHNADRFIATAKDEDGEPLFGGCDAVALPALALTSRERGTGIFWANAFDEDGCDALRERFGYAPSDALEDDHG